MKNLSPAEILRTEAYYWELEPKDFVLRLVLSPAEGMTFQLCFDKSLSK